MNWKEIPNIFANGEFKVRFRGRECELLNYNPTMRGFHLTNDIFPTGYKFAVQTEETLNLIARPIEDMTDEELRECEELWHDIVYGVLENQGLVISAKDAIKSIAGRYTKVDLYLISIGVYPFSDTTDVIFRGKNHVD